MATPPPQKKDRASAPEPRRDLFTPVLVVALAAIVLGFGWILSRVETPISPEVGDGATVLADPIRLPAFTLVDHQGQTFDREALVGDWSLLFFGYSSCPDICPFVLGQLARVSQAWQAREDAGEMPRVVFVSVDPKRDSPERLAEYVPFFDASFRGVSGPPEEIDSLARSLGVFYELRPEQKEGDYLVDHAAKLWLIDPQARFAAVLDDPHESGPFIDLVSRIRALPRPAVQPDLPGESS